MIRFAQILAGLFVLVLGGSALTTIVSPETINIPSGFNAVTNYGFTNLRTLGAPTLSLAIITLIGIFRKQWLFILPASMYFFFNGSARVISSFVEGYEPVMLRGLILTFGLFVLSQLVIYVFRKEAAKQIVIN